jgi:hypothetical protein
MAITGTKAQEVRFHAEQARIRVLANADYAAAGIYLEPVDFVVHTTPGAAGVLGLYLPKLVDCPYGQHYTVWHFGTTNNTTVDDQNDGIVTVGQSALTADNDRVTFLCLGTHWLLIEDVTT